MKLPRAEPFHFGPEECPLFGWLHKPAVASKASLAVLICEPFGYEAICSYRSLRHLAERMAGAGLPTLRFNYFATGNSAGRESSPKVVAAWIASVESAIVALKSITGAPRLCLVGLRLGATLATLVGQGRDDIEGLIAIEAIIKPRAFLRELRALAGARPRLTPPAGAKVDLDIQEAVGFGLTPETRAALAEIDLGLLAKRPARRVLILDRSDLPRDSAWSSHLQTLGTAVERRSFAGYAELMLGAHESIVPTAMIDSVIRWTDELASDIGNDPSWRPIMRPVPDGMRHAAVVENNQVREQALFIDADARLFGILAEPSGYAGPIQPRDVVLLLNSGGISHVGPGRFYVTLARHLARHGVAVLRLDISGIGDSYPHAGEPENSVYTTRATQDIETTLRFLRQRFGEARYHAAGICSGAYHAFKAAVHGRSLHSAIMINPLTFFWKEGMSMGTPEYHVAAESARYGAMALQPASWMRALRGQGDVRAVVRTLARRVLGFATNWARELARRFQISLSDDLAEELAQAAERSERLLFVFAAGDPGLQLLREQGGLTVRRLTEGGKLRVEIIEGADHTFTPHWARDQLLSVLAAHLNLPAVVAEYPASRFLKSG